MNAANPAASSVLASLGLAAENPGAFDGTWIQTHGPRVESHNPATEEVLGAYHSASSADYEQVMAAAVRAFEEWRTWPAPKRGEIVRQLGEELRKHKDALGHLVALEAGKVLSEGLGEVQEMIDMCDFAVGLSRQLYGLSMHSERPNHRMFEQWLPLGTVGVISAFNFPVAVWSWNAALAAVCGDSVVWKPSAQTPLCAIAVSRIAQTVLERNGAPPIFTMILGDRHEVGEKMAVDRRMPLISATGSTKMGQSVGRALADRFGRGLLELGGNNGIIVMDDADLDLALRAVLFAAVGTAGQRCTTTRRLFLQKGIAADMKARLVKAYRTIRIGNPLDASTVMGPLISKSAVDGFAHALKVAVEQGGKIIAGGKVLPGPGYFVEPTLVEAMAHMPITCEETFAPILYLFEFDTLDEAIAVHNSVPQGLSSAIFTLNMRNAERFLSATGSDCGIANVNIGTSGAEIGGAFGGEKETGGGREAGSDSWKIYMRRQTCTVNYGTSLPLAQGVKFDL